MSDLGRVLGWFDSVRLVRPDAETPNFLDLARALFRLSGLEQPDDAPASRDIARLIGPADHIVFVLVDGMGLVSVEDLSPTGFLRSHLVLPLNSIFLSTTACALTTLGTGLWPCDHAVPGWWTWLDDYRLNATMLPFVERATKTPLERMGVAVEKAFPAPSAWPRLTRRPLTVGPADYIDSVYSRRVCGDTARIGYRTLPEAMSVARDRVLAARSPSFTYVYLPQLDELSHHRGTRDAQVKALLAAVEAQIEGLARSLRGRARLVIGADHGQADVSEARKFILPENHPLRARLVTQPTGEPQAPIFHVREGQEDAFAAEFRERFEEFFALVTPDEVERLRLYGPGALSPLMRRRLGTFLGITPEPAVFYIRPVGGSERHIGVHAGLTAEEMRIPLVLA